jgi:cobalt-zinc-cadmium efflux system outer membrane protein
MLRLQQRRAPRVLTCLFMLMAAGAGKPAAAQEGPARATSLPAEVSLDESVSLVRTRSPALRAALAEVRVSDADIDVAGLLPNPEFDYVVMGRVQGDAAAINGSQHQIWLEQPILLGGQQRSRRDEARALSAAQRGDVGALAWSLEIEARRRFLDLLVADERVRLLADAQDRVGRLVGVIEGRAAGGAQSAYDVLRARLVARRVAEEGIAAQAERRRAATALGVLLGVADWAPRPRGTLDELAQASDPRSDGPAPAVEAARLRVVAAERGVARWRRERWPTLGLGLGAYLTTDGGSSSFYGGLSVPLPAWDTGRAQIRRAEAARESAEARLVAVTTTLRARADAAAAELAVRRTHLASLDADIIAELPRLEAMAEAAFRSGTAEVFELLHAFETSLEARARRVDAASAAASAWSDRLDAVGALRSPGTAR